MSYLEDLADVEFSEDPDRCPECDPDEGDATHFWRDKPTGGRSCEWCGVDEDEWRQAVEDLTWWHDLEGWNPARVELATGPVVDDLLGPHAERLFRW